MTDIYVPSLIVTSVVIILQGGQCLEGEEWREIDGSEIAQAILIHLPEEGDLSLWNLLRKAMHATEDWLLPSELLTKEVSGFWIFLCFVLICIYLFMSYIFALKITLLFPRTTTDTPLFSVARDRRKLI